MTGDEVVRRIRQSGCCETLRQRGSHRFFRCQCADGEPVCLTSVPVHRGHDLGAGLLRAIERDLAPCLGEGWLRG